MSDEGVQQGNALASAGFCAAIHPDVVALDAKLAASGGTAKFDMDDGYVLGPPSLVFAGSDRFSATVSESGLELRLD